MIVYVEKHFLYHHLSLLGLNYTIVW